jgi:hypothetical protein
VKYYNFSYIRILLIQSGPGSVVGVVTGCVLDGSEIEFRGGRIFRTCPDRPWVPPSFTLGTCSFLGVKSGRGVNLTPHPLLVPWSWKGRSIPIFPLWAVRPLQNLSARTFYLLIQTLVIRITNYPNGLSVKLVENSRELTFFEITGYRIKYITVLWLLEREIGRAWRVYTPVHSVNCSKLQTRNVTYFQRKIQLSGFSAYPDTSPSEMIRARGVLL